MRSFVVRSFVCPSVELRFTARNGHGHACIELHAAARNPRGMRLLGCLGQGSPAAVVSCRPTSVTVTSPSRLGGGGSVPSRHVLVTSRRHCASRRAAAQRHVTVTVTSPSRRRWGRGQSAASRQRHVAVAVASSSRHGTATSSLGTGAVGSVTVTVTVTSRRRRLVVGDGGSRQRHGTVTVTSRRRRLVVGDGGSRQRHGTSPSRHRHRHRHVTRPRGGPCSDLKVSRIQNFKIKSLRKLKYSPD